MTHRFWLESDTEQAFELHEGGSNLALSRYDAITRITIELRPNRHVTNPAKRVFVDSDTITPGRMAWGGATGAKVQIESSALQEAKVPAGSYRGRIMAYSADQPSGLLWADFDNYAIEVKQ